MPATLPNERLPAAATAGAVRERRLLWLLLLAGAAALAALRWDSHREIEDLESSRLSVQARTIEQNLTRQFAGVRAALRDMREGLPGWVPADRRMRAGDRLHALCVAIPGLKAMRWLDEQGQLVASNNRSGSGLDLSGEAWFQTVRSRPDAAVLYLSQPQAGADGRFAIELSVAMLDADGRFQGALSATLDADYFNTLLASVRYADDMWAAVTHSSGRVLVINPPVVAAIGLSVAREGSLFSRHLASGRAVTLMSGSTVNEIGQRRLTAQRTMRPPELGMDGALVVGTSRNLDVMFAAWQRVNTVVAVLYAAFALTAWFWLRARQRSRQEVELRRAGQAREASRLALALAGGDLALWDADLVSGLGHVNDRWYAMLGYRSGEVAADQSGWESLIHPDDRDRVVAAQAAHVGGQTPGYEAQYRLRHKQGHWIWILDRGRVVEHDAAGHALRMVGTHMDISERVASEEALRRSEESLAITLYSIGDAVIATDDQGRVARMNATAERLTGWAAAEALGQPLAAVFRIFDARTRQPALDPVARALASGEIVGLANDTLLQARDGSEHPIADSAAPIRDASGATVGVVLVFSDVSESYRMTQALREREAQLALVTDMLPGPVARIGSDRRYRFANAAYREWFGIEPAALIGRTCAEALGEGIAALVYEQIGQALQGQVLRFDRAVPVRGGVRDVIVNLTPDRDARGLVQGVFMVVTDITERKRAEGELRLLEAAVASLDDMVLITEAEPLEEPGPRIVFANDAFVRHTGWPREQVLGRSPRFLRSAATDVTELARIDAALAMGQAVRTELVNQTRDGRPYWVDISIVPLRDANGRITHIVSVHRDITDRRRAAAAVQDARQELAATLAAVPDLLFDLDAEGLIHNYHSPRRDLLLVRPGQIIGARVRDHLPPPAAAVVHQALHEARAKGYSGGLQYQLDLPGGPRWFELSISAKAAPQGTAAEASPRFIALARDVTERRQAEAGRLELEGQLREAQKIESIGTLAGGIAHDFNNILAAILGNVSLARGDLSAEHPALFSLEQIRKGSLRARALVQQILTFSRRQPNPLRVQPLQPVVEETVALLRATLPAAVRVATRLAAQPLWLQADATQLQQVLMNLCTNAWHALPDSGGTIEIGCEALPAGDPALAQEEALAGQPVVHLWVQDDGAGMDEQTRERIFDPFYTTKPVGQGTGLGLSVVHGIVRGHSGRVRVDSQPRQGSTFHLYFPATAAPGTDAATDEAVGGEPGGGGQHVLYVDDDEVMVLMVERLLQRAGYVVVTCGQARQALALVQAAPQRFDLVISDFNMPEQSGLDLARQLLALQPQLRLVITSGYITDELREKAAALGVRALLNKEETIEELAGLVQRVLAA